MSIGTVEAMVYLWAFFLSGFLTKTLYVFLFSPIDDKDMTVLQIWIHFDKSRRPVLTRETEAKERKSNRICEINNRRPVQRNPTTLFSFEVSPFCINILVRTQLLALSAHCLGYRIEQHAV